MMGATESSWKRLRVAGSGWRRMTATESGREWLRVAESGWE